MANSQITDPLLLELIASKFITVNDAKHICAIAQTTKCSTTQNLITEKNIPPKEIALALSRSLQLDYVDLSEIVKADIPTDPKYDSVIKEYHVLPLLISNNTLYLGIREPNQLKAYEILKFHTHLHIQPVITEWHKLSNLITHHLNEQQYRCLQHPFILQDTESDEKIITFVQHIIVDAIHKLASDIHFEPCKTRYRIRLRIDGILHAITELPIELAPRITARLKIMSNLNIAEKRLPQDGRFHIQANEEISRDCRISTCPTLFGEKTVIRILKNQDTSFNIYELGMNTVQQTIFLQEISRPQGMILVTGPTGSGKTLTLYSALHILNTLEKNISTVEDPVEIELHGTNQVNIDHKVNLTFLTVLRTLLRQDPDILMVGEIRDKETADMTIKSSQTGHLVLSTLHTNSAYETVNRLQLMGIAPFNLIDAVRLILAQRLIRKLCPHCKAPSLSNPGFYEAVGCEYCTEGYKGRIGIFEFLPMTEDIKRLIIRNVSADEIREKAKQIGHGDLHTAALEKAQAGMTSLTEAYRVTS